jgi:hypothetical protein
MLVNSHSSDPEFALTRSDLVAAVDAYRQASRSPAAWAPLAGMFFSLLIGAAGATAAESLGWPAWAPPTFVLSGIGAVLGFLVVGRRRQRQVLARTQWECPQCAAPLIAASGLNPLARAEMAIASGRCPSCAHALFEPSQAEGAGT